MLWACPTSSQGTSKNWIRWITLEICNESAEQSQIRRSCRTLTRSSANSCRESMDVKQPAEQSSVACFINSSFFLPSAAPVVIRHAHEVKCHFLNHSMGKHSA